jgi:hypothetical protein
MSQDNEISKMTVFGIVISSENNSISPQGNLGIVLNQQYNSFARKTASVIVFENKQFGDFLDVDIDDEFFLTSFNTGDMLRGIAFNNDNDITNAIQSGVLCKVFESIRQHLEKAQ